MTFDAFISYANGQDTRIAKALQDNLHRLAKRWDSLSAIRVFRDATHLQITSLEPALVGALTDSNFLILLASPESAASTWVRKELSCFLDTHPPERVLIVLVGGNLVWDASLNRFAPGPECALPSVEKFVFAKEPLFLDLRWAADEPDLSLSNPRCLDAAATLAATLQGVPKETLVGDLVEEHRKLHRNQRINLGFRGAAGFGIPAAVFLLLGAAFSFTSDAVLSSPTSAYLYFVIGFPAIGAIGALSCGMGWRAMVSYAAGFLVLLPLYVMSSLQPFASAALDYLVLAAMSLAGFVAAGALGAAGCRMIRWSDGAKAFSAGGVIVASLWPVLGSLRPGGIHTALAAWPWLSSRFGLQAQRAVASVADILGERGIGMLIPLVVGVIAGGLVLGVRLADARMMTSTTPAKVKTGRASKFLTGLLVRRTLTAALVLLVAAWGYSLSDLYQTAKATRALSADPFRGLLIVRTGDNADKVTQAAALPIALRARNALAQRGERAAAEQISSLIHDAVQTFAQTPSLYYERYTNPGYHPPGIGDVARMLKSAGRPEELAHLLTVARQHVKAADVAGTIAAARVEGMYGNKEIAAGTLQDAMGKLDQQDWFARSLLAQAYFELGHVDTAKDLLRRLSADITARTGQHPSAMPGDNTDLAPESGGSFWHTGIWNELPEWRNEFGEVSDTAIEGLCRDGKRESAIKLLLENGKHSGASRRRARCMIAAAEMQHYETAFAVLDGHGHEKSPGKADFFENAQGLTAIIRTAAAHGRTSVVRKAVAQLRSLEQAAFAARKLDRSAGIDVINAPWSEDLAIGIALSAAGSRTEAASRLADAWRGLQRDRSPHAPVQHDSLSAIGAALAGIGELKAARSVANDIGSDFGHYAGGLEAVSQLAIYTAILEYSPAGHTGPNNQIARRTP